MLDTISPLTEVQAVGRRRTSEWRQIVRLNGLRSAFVVGCLIAPLAAGTSAGADEFDPVVAYEEASVLNDQWQACAASFIRGRLQTRETEEWLAEQALARCRARQDDLSQFLVKRVEKKSASNVMALLREKYRTGLVSAITELRTRN